MVLPVTNSSAVIFLINERNGLVDIGVLEFSRSYANSARAPHMALWRTYLEKCHDIGHTYI